MTVYFREPEIFTICPSKKNIHQSQSRGPSFIIDLSIKEELVEWGGLSLEKRISKVNYLEVTLTAVCAHVAMKQLMRKVRRMCEKEGQGLTHRGAWPQTDKEERNPFLDLTTVLFSKD